MGKHSLEASSFAGTNYADVLLTRGSSVFGLIARIFGKICLFAAIAAYIRHTFFPDADTLLIKNENSGPSDRN